ncbi:MAG: methyltransferase domain-containing protein [Gammaproteobacteria bacterium]|jgi:predicted nicotinamide N-methyase|nr:methyltransferase domain-containing protein [Gammaproteobacteria bacterium]MBT3860722.1 methyltransferase domain-containing protein [Gammaproteobacteria bacterium]MBT3988129.1 methyltransferase domain-containing protein [Gammaproteobacteria bacterium]MBT4255525.1 methyltransferase domain-containing protein [Gammaproteobacteria bacterium]MBT4583406.1 methyltransferase domain-containing protein [Gammaproteobacteria bacterium]
MTLPLRVSYQTVEFGKTDIHLCTLRDKQEYSDPEGIAESLGISSSLWPLFGVIWPSSLVLAHHILDYQTEGKRILEIGCGMALSSLLLNKQNADITATDYHPEVELFLKRNAILNEGNVIPFERTSWTDEEDKLGRFDLIIGSDVLYEDGHVEQLAGFLNYHAKPNCEVILVDPGRGRKTKMGNLMTEYGFVSSEEKPEHTDYLKDAFKGYILTFRREA